MHECIHHSNLFNPPLADMCGITPPVEPPTTHQRSTDSSDRRTPPSSPPSRPTSRWRTTTRTTTTMRTFTGLIISSCCHRTVNVTALFCSLCSNNDTVTTDRPAVLNDAYYLEDEDVSDEEDVPVENRDQIQKLFNG